MSASALPVPTAQRADFRPRARSAVRYSSLDRLRLAEWNRRREIGEQPLAAWLAVITDQEIGTRDFRGKNAAPAARVQHSLAKFLERTCPGAMAEAQATARHEAAALASRAIHRIDAIARGEFGEGKVTFRGRGENREEVVEIDAAAASVQLQANKTLLQAAGVLVGEKGAGGPVQVNTQVNVGQSPHDLADALSRDPLAQAAAIDAARRVSSQRDPAAS